MGLGAPHDSNAMQDGAGGPWMEHARFGSARSRWSEHRQALRKRKARERLHLDTYPARLRRSRHRVHERGSARSAAASSKRRLIGAALAWLATLSLDVKRNNIISSHDIKGEPSDDTLEFLLAFNGRRHYFEEGYWIKFEIIRVAPAKTRPHGLSYSFTLHAPNGKRLVGFDNAHGVAPASRFKKRQPASDHWHRTEDDPGRPYAFKDADTLLQDFFCEVRRVLSERGVSETVVKVEEGER